MKEQLKSLARTVLGDYGVYRVFRTDQMPGGRPVGDLIVRDVEAEEFQTAVADETLMSSSWYFGSECSAFGAFDDGKLVGVAFYWSGQRYASRASWPIELHAAKLVHVVTAQSHRNRGVASRLIAASASLMIGKGFCPLYARVWHSHSASLSAFYKAGWGPCGWLVQLNPLRLPRSWSIVLRR